MAARGVLVVVVAALLGFLILKNGFDSGATVNTGTSPGTSTTTAAPTTTAAGGRPSSPRYAVNPAVNGSHNPHNPHNLG